MEKGPIKTKWESFAIDATTFEHRGKRYKPEYPWEIIGFWVNEGPAVLKRHGRIFMTYSASATDENYAMGMLTADESSNLLDPASWSKPP